MSLTAASIISEFNLVTTGSVSTNSDIEGSAVIGGSLAGATFFGSNAPTHPVVYLYGALNGVQNGLNIDNGGDLYYTGQIDPPTVNFSGGHQITSGPPDPLSDFTTPLTNLSTELGSLSGTGGSISISNNDLIFSAVAGSNGLAVFDISESQLTTDMQDSSSMEFNIPAGVTGVIVNVTGSGAFTEPSNFNWNGSPLQDVMFNFTGASSVAIGNWESSILAPDASVQIDNGALNGFLFASSFLGGGELHNYTYTGSIPLCYCAGTRVLTENGEVCVENLSAGDMVVVVDGETRALRPVRWVGRSVVSRRFADPLRVLPIRIRAGALADNVPCRDLLVSPGHGVLIGEVLVHAGSLVNGMTVVREHNAPMEFTYYHVELDTHSLLLAEGAAAESFLDGVDDLPFANWDDRVPPEVVEELPYPRAKAYRQVPRAIRERLAARAGRAALSMADAVAA